MNRNYIREDDSEDRYVPRMERRQRIAIAILAVLLLIAGSMAAYKASAQAPRTATISFTAPTRYTDGTSIASGTTITYGVYQALKGQPKTRVATITATSTTVSTGLQASEYCWHVTAIIGGTESDPSEEKCKSFLKPETVTITVT